jgi:hypothetical protein
MQPEKGPKVYEISGRKFRKLLKTINIFSERELLGIAENPPETLV